MKHWNIRIYDAHVGIVDENDCTVASISGDPYDLRTMEKAVVIVAAVNRYLNSSKRIDEILEDRS